MGECGCIEGNFQWKIIDQEGWAWLLGIYPSCDYCESSVGLQFFRVKPDDWHLWDVENIPTLEPTQKGNGFIEFIGPVAVKKAMEKAIIGYKDYQTEFKVFEVDDGESHIVVAKNKDEAKAEVYRPLGYECESDFLLGESLCDVVVREYPPNNSLAVYEEDGTRTEMSCQDWANKGPGIVGSTCN